MLLRLALRTCLELVRCFLLFLSTGFIPDPGPALLGSMDHLAAAEGERGSRQMFPWKSGQEKLLSGSWRTLRNVGVR